MGGENSKPQNKKAFRESLKALIFKVASPRGFEPLSPA